MEDARRAGKRASLTSYVSKLFRRDQPGTLLDATDAKISSEVNATNTETAPVVERPEEAPNTLNVSYLQRAPSQWASNTHWYSDDLSRAKDMTVRLLYLEPGQSQDPIAGRLVCHPVKQKPRYDALSYSWGEQDDWTQITLDGRPGFAVTQTLCSALRRLRSTAVARPIWIDAICINQSNVAERNQQVDMMSSTFGNARSVLIWLGDCGDRDLADQGQRSPAPQILTKLEQETQDVTKAWWNRLWVVQEVALAKELMVYFGPHVLTWADFFASAESRPNFRGVVNLRTARAFVQSHEFAPSEEVTLEALLALTGNCYASDPLDYVFGIIGLVPKQQPLRQHRLSPDYTLTPYELLTRLNSYLESIGYQFAGTTMLNKMLSWSAHVGHLQLARLLLDSDQVDLETEGPLALCHAAEHGRRSILKLLLEDFHLNVDSSDRMGRTPLSWAAASAESDTVRLLIHGYHADPDAKDHLGRTPLSWAVACRAQDVRRRPKILDTVRTFLDIAEVDPDSEDAKGRTPLAWAVYAGSEPLVTFLLDTGRTDPWRHFGGHPLLDWAVSFGNHSVVARLHERCAPDWRSKDKADWESVDAVGSRPAGPFNYNFWSDGLSEVGEETVQG